VIFVTFYIGDPFLSGPSVCCS